MIPNKNYFPIPEIKIYFSVFYLVTKQNTTLQLLKYKIAQKFKNLNITK